MECHADAAELMLHLALYCRRLYCCLDVAKHNLSPLPQAPQKYHCLYLGLRIADSLGLLSPWSDLQHRIDKSNPQKELAPKCCKISEVFVIFFGTVPLTGVFCSLKGSRDQIQVGLLPI